MQTASQTMKTAARRWAQGVNRSLFGEGIGALADFIETSGPTAGADAYRQAWMNALAGWNPEEQRYFALGYAVASWRSTGFGPPHVGAFVISNRSSLPQRARLAFESGCAFVAGKSSFSVEDGIFEGAEVLQ